MNSEKTEDIINYLKHRREGEILGRTNEYLKKCREEELEKIRRRYLVKFWLKIHLVKIKYTGLDTYPFYFEFTDKLKGYNKEYIKLYKEEFYEKMAKKEFDEYVKNNRD